MNLLFSINQKCAQHLCTCIRSIIKNGGEEHYEIYILHSDLGSNEMEMVHREAGSSAVCHFIPVDETIFDGFPETSRYPKQIYYRLASPLLLPETVDKILYLDVDIIVINPLRELYQMDFEGNYYIACSHVREFLTRFNQLRLGIEENVPYINTGMMVMNISLLRQNLTISQIRDTAQRKMHAFLLPDQDILAVMHGEHIKLVEPIRYNLSDRILSIYNANPQNSPLDLQWIRKNSVIIHYCGKNKPWNNNYSGILNVFYHEIQDH